MCGKHWSACGGLGFEFLALNWLVGLTITFLIRFTMQ